MSKNELDALDKELVKFRQSLPDDLQLDSSRLTVMGHLRESTSYIALHTTLLLCRCDLHRFLIPGIRESVSEESLSDTPGDFAAYCQETCLNGALALCDLFSDIYALDTKKAIDTPTFTVTLYQCVKIIGCLYYLLPGDGPNSLEELKRKLTEALSLARPIQSVFIWLRPCVSKTFV